MLLCDMSIEKKSFPGKEMRQESQEGRKGDCSQCLKEMICKLDHYLLLSGYRSQSKGGQKEYAVQTTEHWSLLSLEA